MAKTSEPYLCDLQCLGYIEGSTIRSQASGEVLCHYFGGLPYALPPTGQHRWRKPRPLPPGYSYGTRLAPGSFRESAKLCPQYPPRLESEQPPLQLQSEDCLQTNIWMPKGEAPESGWPVYFYLHGGSLQWGTPNELDYADMLSQTEFKAIIVSPAYRLNVFGFLASQELLQEAESAGDPQANFGFWDQRLALEWTRENIGYFKGNPSNITVAGYSAGSHSVFYQLSYDLGLPSDKAIIKRAVMHSNSPGVQPKFVAESQLQFDELLSNLGIPLDLPSAEKLRRLRETPAQDLVAANMRMNIHEIRSVSDGTFVRKTLFREIEDGTYARVMKGRGIQLWIGECSEEHFLYRTLRPPKGDSFAALQMRALGEYPEAVANALIRLYCRDGALPAGCKDWSSDAFGHIWADVQVHALERGFIACLARTGAASLVHRYRIEWRAKETDAKAPREWGVTHGTDNSIWVWGEGRGLEPEEKAIAQTAYFDLYAKFVAGEDISEQWGARSPSEVRRLKADGTVDVWKDELWDRGLEVWDALMKAGRSQEDDAWDN
ncbi:alpha/beta-hydrolase [Thozetella sp. PMI_491]|nr:alpha/beta-hydrolase [Thozetella sp. PMI_491]